MKAVVYAYRHCAIHSPFSQCPSRPALICLLSPLFSPLIYYCSPFAFASAFAHRRTSQKDHAQLTWGSVSKKSGRGYYRMEGLLRLGAGGIPGMGQVGIIVASLLCCVLKSVGWQVYRQFHSLSKCDTIVATVVVIWRYFAHLTLSLFITLFSIIHNK